MAAVLALIAGLSASLAACDPNPANSATNRTGYITIAGGVKLAYDLTLPASSGRFPVALEYNDYSAGADNSAEVPGSDAGRLLAAGFAVLGVNFPGSGCSGGINDVTDVNEWGRAGAQAVDWAASQKWSTGHVGMFGSSQTGISQLGVASFRPKGLDAITPFHIPADYYRDVIYPGGVFNSKFVKWYGAYLVTIDKQTAAPAIKSGDRQCLQDFRAHAEANPRYSISRNASRHPFDDAYWAMDPMSALRRVDIPILGCQSWQDGIVSSRATELYQNTFNASRTWFVGTNGPHGICEFDQPLTMLVSFLRHYVAGVGNGWQHTPHVTILHELQATSTSAPQPGWTSTYTSWSHLIKPVTLYFTGNRSLATSPVTSAAAGRSAFSGPAPSQSGQWTKTPAPGTSVSYTTPPLANDADFFGPGSVNLWLSSTATDSDVEVIISEVRPDGTEQFVQAGWLNLAERQLGPAQSSVLRPFQLHTAASYQPLKPGTPVYAQVELFPFEHVFRKGSSIRITIDSASGGIQPNGYWGVTGPTSRFTDTIFASPSRPSDVVLGLIPGATAKRPLPSCAHITGEPCRPNATPVPRGRLTIPGS